MSEVRTYVLAAGLACPLGLRSRPAIAAILAGISRFGEVRGVHDRAGEPARASRLESLDPALSRTGRAAFFGAHALTETLLCLPAGRPRTIPLFLALPEQASDQGQPLQPVPLMDELIAAAARAPAPVALLCKPAHCFPQGRAGFFNALQTAITTVIHGESDLAVVGAADSLAHDMVVRAIARDDRLLGPANQDGIIPGEAAAFILVAARTPPFVHHPVATVDAMALHQQPAFVRDGPLDASALTAVLAALRQAIVGRVDTILSAQPGQTLWARQFAVAHLRNTGLVPEPLRHALVGDALGDLGAAAVAVAAAQLIGVLAAGSCARGLVYGLSEQGLVGGAVFSATQPHRGGGDS